MKFGSSLRYIWFKAGKFVSRQYHNVRSFFARFTFSYRVDSLKSTPIMDLPHPVDWRKISDYDELIAEIGSGHGEVLRSFRDKNAFIVGFETKSRYYRLSLSKIRKIPNAFIYKFSGYEGIELLFFDNSLSHILVLFPDPWHKAKHHKRRPLTSEWFTKVAKKLKPGGHILIATDWEEYADFIEKEFFKVKDNYEIEKGSYFPQKFDLPITHYYQKWVRHGRKFTYFKAIKKG